MNQNKLSPSAQRVLAHVDQLQHKYGFEYINAGHILAACLMANSDRVKSAVRRILNAQNCTPEAAISDFIFDMHTGWEMGRLLREHQSKNSAQNTELGPIVHQLQRSLDDLKTRLAEIANRTAAKPDSSPQSPPPN